MSDDGQKKPQSVADALAQANWVEEQQEDATLQISKTELAAIRESTSNPAMTPEVLREINRRRQGESEENDDPTQTFDRDNLDSLLEQHSSPTEEVDPIADDALASAALEDAAASTQTGGVDDKGHADEFDDIENLAEFSDADLHAVVFGDDAPSTPDELELAELELAELELDEPELAEPHMAEPVVTDPPKAESLAPDAHLAPDDIDPFDDEEFDVLEEMTEDDLFENLSLPSDIVQQPVDEALATEQPAASLAADQESEFLDDELITDFRSPLSRLVMSAALVSAVAMIVAGVLRFATTGMLAMIHPAVAGLLIAVGVLVLLAMLISSMQRGSQ